MITEKEVSLKRAEKSLAAKTRDQVGEQIEIFRGFRKVEEHRLSVWHKSGGGGREVARQRADLVDILFRQLFAGILRKLAPKGLSETLAVAALGGYGRRELLPGSDIDIMFLIPRAQPSALIENIIRSTITALWDIGYKVGHFTHSLPQAIKQANADLITKTAMLESRHLASGREMFLTFKTRFEKDCVRGREKEYIAWRLANQAEMLKKFGHSVFMQEPNVKSGRGSLRDCHNLLWISHFKVGVATMAKLVDKRILTGSERRSLEKSYEFLLRVRSELHLLSNRPQDNLTLQLQGCVATAFHYPQRHILRRVEAFMLEYYSHSRNISLITRSALDRMELVPEVRRLVELFKPKAENFDGFVARQGKLFAGSKDLLAEDPFRLIRAFQHMQARDLELSTELRDLIRRELRHVNRPFQYARSARESFLTILTRKGQVGRVLREMHELGFLGRFIPEFGALTCLVQHEFFHRYTADEHTLVCIEKLDEIHSSKEARFHGYRSVFQRLEDPAILYFALLLHDTGKVANSRHHEDASATLAQKVARRFQLSPERRRMLIVLVNSHCELSSTAQKRNLDDPATITEFSGIVGDRVNLDALMLLTVADGLGTSDQNWSDWKEELVWSLYRQTRHYLEAGPEALTQQQRSRGEVHAEVAKLMPLDYGAEMEAHFQYMPSRYFQMFDSKEIAGHLKLFRTFLENHLTRNDPPPYAPAFQWIARPDQGHSEVWVCGWDRPRLLERIAGAFLAAQINILSADIFTRGDNLAIDTFRVCLTGMKPVTHLFDIARVETRLIDSLAVEEFDFSPLLGKDSRLRSWRISQEADLPAQITIDNSSHPIYTIVDVRAPDRLGLLYDLLRAFGAAGVNIEISRITTEMEFALDSFYITARDGRKVEDESAIARLQKLLPRAAARPRPPATRKYPA